jgi:H+/Cl- antiporter ClcA
MNQQEHKLALLTDEKKEQSEHLETLLMLFGPPFARARRFWVAMMFALIMGTLLGAVALGFFNFFEEIGALLWNSEAYQESIKVNSTGDAPSWGSFGQWWYIGLGSACGLGIGVIKLAWTLLVSPFPRNPPSLVTEVKDLHVHEPANSICILLVSAMSLAGGASVGPEAALGAVGASVGSVLGASSFVTRYTGSPQTDIYALMGMAGAFGPLLPSPILSVMLLHELSIATHVTLPASFMETMLLSGFAASASFAFFTGLKDLTFLETVRIPAAEIFVRDPWTVNMAYAVPLGMLAGGLGLVGIIFLGVGQAAGRATFNGLEQLGERMGLAHVGMVLTPAVGGVLFGLIAVAFPLTLGDGASQLGEIVKSSFNSHPAFSAHFLVSLGVAKMLSLALCLGFGFIGGQIFPLMFAGACVGSAATQVTGVSALVCLPCLLVAVPCAFTPALFSLVMLVSTLLSLGGEATAPVFVSCMVAYATVCGCGLLQNAIARKLTSLK